MRLELKDGNGDKVHFYLDGEYAFTADRLFAAACGYKSGCDITAEQVQRLEQDVLSRRAYNKAAGLLSRRDHCSGELVEKLCQKGHERRYAEMAVQRLREQGYIDDEQYARDYAAQLSKNRHYGRRRIAMQLISRGIEPSLANKTASELEMSEDAALQALESKYGGRLDSEAGVRRAIAGLSRLGFSYDEIKSALREYKNRNDEQ